MCLHTLQQEPKVAEDDIIVWKLLHHFNNEYSSPNQSFIYKLGIVYKTKMTKVKTGKYATGEEWEWVEGLMPTEFERLSIIAEGFHSYTDKKFIKGDLRYQCVLVKGIVPKGSLYYTNHLGLITSDTIQMIKTDNF